MDNKTILMVIAAALVVIAGVLVYQSQQKTPAEEVAESISGAIDGAANN